MTLKNYVEYLQYCYREHVKIEAKTLIGWANIRGFRLYAYRRMSGTKF